MEKTYGLILSLSKILALIAGIALTVMMCLTVADVIGRAGGYPILGTAELVSLLCVVAIGFAVPLTSLRKRHVYMEFLIERMGRGARKAVNTATRAITFLIFALAGTNLFHMGAEFSASREVSMALCIPLYPFAYGAGACCLIQAAVCLFEIARIWGGET
jgi:TRAP-type C4-dicarboxylate transport system permease small subunit